MISWYKDTRFWEGLEQMGAPYANRNGYSDIHVAFRELHSEKQSLEQNTQNYIQNKRIQKNQTYLSWARNLIVIQQGFIEIVDIKSWWIKLR